MALQNCRMMEIEGKGILSKKKVVKKSVEKEQNELEWMK